ncbi:MAG: sugar nucleotide-binding protein [Abditibacteriota bacterium]|nr:sugar nucleotide-binding protein [Abditibacteriota bacterium]
MKFLVLGCNGMAGHIISIYLKEIGHETIGLAREESKYVDTIAMDVTDFNELKKVVLEGNYDFIVNCIGILNQFAEENHDQAVILNSYLPHYLVKITQDIKTRIIHLSTDCVFSGKDGNYTEFSFPDGQTFYDRTKALGEINDYKNITIRCSIVGPDIKEEGIGLLNWFMKQNNQIFGFRKAIWTGLTSLQLAKTINLLSKSNAYGLFNMVPDIPINKYDLLKLFNKYIRKHPIEILPKDDFVLDKSLIRTRYDKFKYKMPDYETQVKELGEWMREHKEIYENYDL